jgi:hypothetical protein
MRFSQNDSFEPSVREPPPSQTTVGASDLSGQGQVDECPTPAQTRFFDELGTIAGAMDDALAEWDAANVEASIDPSLVFDNAWRTRAAIALASITFWADELLALESPPGTEEIGALLDAAANDYKASTRLYGEAIDQLDVAIMIESSRALDSATASMYGVVDRSRAFCR